MSLQTIERRSGYSLQTGWGYVRVAPFSDDALVSIKDVLEVMQSNPKLTIHELLDVIQRHAASQRADG